MKFKKLIKVLDPITYIIIWTQDDKEEPAFEGFLHSLPWPYLDYKIGRIEKKADKPIYVSTIKRTLTTGKETLEPALIINLIAK